ncbi:hypothetical protein [Streptomyces cinerochromogenes]|uniref:hypothetical protein n=1 Tax=Streptomyces cinerochromogenes TaxID=66422 RepID=UPI0033A2ED05
MPSWTGRISKAVVALTIALGGVVTGTGSAHADSASLCRSDTTSTHSYVPITDNIEIDSCYHVQDDRRTIYATIPFYNTNRDDVVFCAHLVNVNNPGVWVHDFGCDYATTNWYGTAWPGNCCYGQGMEWTATPGTYVVSAGFWLNGRYYGDVQSPRTTIG